MSNTPKKFKLQNGLDAILHTPKSHVTKKLLKNCSNPNWPRGRADFLFAIEVKIGGERLYLIYLTFANAPDKILSQLKAKMECTIYENFAIIYNNTAYLFNTSINCALSKAVIRKINPDLMEQVRKAVIKTCREHPIPRPDFQLDPSRFCVVEVVVCNEKVSLVYLLKFVPSWLEYKRLRLLDKSVAKTLYMYFRDDLNAIIDLPGYAVYEGVAYPSSKNFNRLIKTAIKNAMPPSVAILTLNSKK